MIKSILFWANILIILASGIFLSGCLIYGFALLAVKPAKNIPAPYFNEMLYWCAQIPDAAKITTMLFFCIYCTFAIGLLLKKEK